MNNDCIKRLIDNIKIQQEAWNKVAQPFAQTIQQMNAQLEPYRRMSDQVQKHIQAAHRASEPMRRYIARLQASLEPMRDMMRRFIEKQQMLKDSYRKAQDFLFEQGWYLGCDMPLPNYETLAKMIDAGEHAQIETAMCEWARANMDEIIENAASAFPKRAQILTDAAKAHCADTYSLSIPVFFAQSDGMANDILGYCLFRGNPPKALEKTLAQFDGFPLSDMSEILLDPLRSFSSFYTCSTKQATKSGVILANRSEVMHGSQLDYISEANSLRCIVLLGYLVGVKSHLKSHAEHVNELRWMMNETLESDEEALDPEHGSD